MLHVKNLSFQYGKHVVLNHVSFEAPFGSCVAVLGNNGAGKSTLIKCLNKILVPSSGQALLDGSNLLELSRPEIAKQLAYVAQYSESSRFTVYDTVLLGRKPYIKFAPAAEDEKIVQNIIDKMDLGKLALSFLDELSGGELQKVMLARALAQQPKVLLLDEPTSSLDLRNQHEMLGLVHRLAKSENISVILVIHDLNLALRYCDKFLFLKENKVYSYGGIETMTRETIENVYGIPVSVSQVCGSMTIVPFPNQKD
jgi:iron complex transport system ATP-binding protein